MNRHAVSTTLLVALLATRLPRPASSAQWLTNASFEQQGSQTDLAAGWSRWGDWINRHCDWTPRHEGTCLIGYHHWQISGTGTSGLWQDIAGVQPGTTYVFRIYVNSDAVTTNLHAAKSVEIRMETSFFGQQSVIASRIYNVRTLAGGTDWSLLQVRARAPNDRLRVVILVTPGDSATNRSGAVKFDDASLTDE